MNTEVFSFLSFSSCLSGTSTQNFLKIAWICACAKSVVNFVMRRRESIVCHGGLLILVHRGSLVGFFKSWASFEECVFLRLLYFAVPFPISFRNEHNMKTIANIWGFSIRLVLANMAETRWKRQSGTLRSQHISPKPVEMQFVKLICNAPACPIAGLSERSEHDRKGNICLPTDRPHHSRMNWTPRVSQSRNQSFMAAVSGYEAWLQNGTWDLGHWEPDNVTSTIVKGRPTLFVFFRGGVCFAIVNRKSQLFPKGFCKVLTNPLFSDGLWWDLHWILIGRREKMPARARKVVSYCKC